MAEETLWSGKHFEFDILPNPNEKTGKGTRAQIKGGRWPNGVVPYEVGSGFSE